MIQGALRTEKEYRQVDMDSSSSLKEFSLDRRKYHKKYVKGETVEDEEQQSKAAIVGQVVETLLFEKDTFDNKFYMSSLAKAPTGLMLEFTEALYRRSKEATKDGEITKDFSEIAELAYKDSGFKVKLEAVLGKFQGSDAEIYYKEIRQIRAKGLVVVTTDDVTNAEKTVEELRTNIFTSHIIGLVSSNRYTRYIQYKIEGFDIDGLPLKSMMDLVIIDHVEKTIQVYDLKCVWSVEGFFEDYYLYRRAYIQAYLYKEACKAIRTRENLEYYDVLEPKFIVCDSINYFNPLIYALSSDDTEDAYVGFEYKGRHYPGVKDIILDLKWAKENDIWNISRTNYLNKGIVNIRS